MTTVNVISMALSNHLPPTPEVGMGATRLGYSDRHAHTIIEVSKSGKRITVQRDHAVRTDSNGMSDMQTWECTPNPTGATQVLSLRKNGRWAEVGGTTFYSIGTRREYYDYGF